MANYAIAQLDDLPPTACPCGSARRAFADMSGAAASLHIVDVTADARTHYHRRMTEIYLILEGEGEIELDGERFPIRPMTAIYIRPGCRHRAIGTFRMINVPVPAFDPGDEWFD